MSVLTQKFPTSLQIGGVDCLINSDFRTVLYCSKVIEEKKELSEGDLLEILTLFYKISDTPLWKRIFRKKMLFTEEHITKLFWFVSCGREKEQKHFPRKIAGINDKQPFDFVKDADLIYAGFLQQYGIDLQTEEMHWWKFMILLENLGSSTRLSKVMEYRTLDTANKSLSKEERAFYKAMQKYYSLDSKIVLDEQTKRIEDALLRGEDISKMLEGDNN